MVLKKFFILIIFLFFSTSDAMAVKILEDIGKTLDKAVKKGAEDILKDMEKKEQEKEKTEDKETQKPAESKPVPKKEAEPKPVEKPEPPKQEIVEPKPVEKPEPPKQEIVEPKPVEKPEPSNQESEDVLKVMIMVYNSYLNFEIGCVTSKVMNKSEYQPLQKNMNNLMNLLLTYIKVPEDKWDQVKDERYNKAVEQVENDESYISLKNMIEGGLSDLKKVDMYIYCSDEVLPGLNLMVNTFTTKAREDLGTKPKTQKKRDF